MTDKRWRLLLYGDPKVGKTSLAETCPGPRLILDAEGGTDWLASDTMEWDPSGPPPTDLPPDISVVVHTTNWETVEAVNAWLQRGDHAFVSVVLDSLTELQKQCKRAITDQGFRIQDWGALYDKMDPVLRQIRDLTKHPTNPVWCVVITALAKQDNAGKTVPDIQGSMARSLPGQIDTIGYLSTVLATDGSSQRKLIIDANSTLYAGDRTKVLRRSFHGGVPVVIDDATDTLQWNLTELLRFMNQSPEESAA